MRSELTSGGAKRRAAPWPRCWRGLLLAVALLGLAACGHGDLETDVDLATPTPRSGSEP